MSTLEQNYYDRLCERDSLWDVFCKLPFDSNWARYEEACKELTLAEQKLTPDKSSSELDFIIKEVSVITGVPAKYFGNPIKYFKYPI